VSQDRQEPTAERTADATTGDTTGAVDEATGSTEDTGAVDEATGSTEDTGALDEATSATRDTPRAVDDGTSATGDAARAVDEATSATRDTPRAVDEATSARGTIRYLSLAWIDAIANEVETSEQMHELAAQHAISVTQLVSDGPEGDVTYHLVVGDGDATFGAGPADPEDVRMEQEWDTAVAVATGELNAGDAFANGHIRLYGDQQKLLDANAVFGPLDRVFRAVGARTRYE
jgi:putative sterol carrier protein